MACCGVREIVVESVGQLVDAITPDKRDVASGRFRDAGVYRGSSHRDWPLLSSLDRLGGESPPHTKVELEEHILRNFQRYSRPFLSSEPADEWEMLVIARHHGLPTRLTDWSYSPLVAAHFATLNPRPADRVIWRLEWQRIHEHFGLKPLAFLISDLESLLREKGTTLWEVIQGKSPSDLQFMCMLEPPSLDQRLVAQSATFVLSSIVNQSIDRFLCEQGLAGAITRYIIPATARDRIRDQLDLCSIDERHLFPDLDGVAAQIRRYYS